MNKFHINTAGEAGQCKAVNGKCPFGSESEHFTSAEAAREAFEARQESFATPAKRETAYVAAALKEHRSTFTPKSGAAELEALFAHLDDQLIEANPEASAAKRAELRGKLLLQLGAPKNYGDDDNPSWAWPTAKDREAAVLEVASEARKLHGDDSTLFRQWGKIHADFKTVDSRDRKLVLVNDKTRGAILTPWYGPKILESLKSED